MTTSRRFTAVIAPAIVICFGMLAAATAFGRVSVLPQVGQSCTEGSLILSTQGCYHNIIQCKPGYSACGGKCVNLASDTEHCGACAQQCNGQSKICTAGICEPPFRRPLPHPYMSKPATLVPLPSSGGPTGWELKPTRSQTTGDLFAINGSGRGLNSGTSGCGNFYSVIHFDTKGVIKSVSPDSGFYQSAPWGDSWAASSGYAGLELFSVFDPPFLNDYDEKAVFNDGTVNLITLPYSNSTPCGTANPIRTAGIGATTAANLTAPAKWDAPIHTWFRPEAEDGQNMYADPGGTGLFLIGSAGAAEHSRFTGHEIGTGVHIGGSVDKDWHTVPGDTYPGYGGALWMAPNCRSFPNLNSDPSLVQTNKGFALSPNCPFAQFGSDYVSPHDLALSALPQFQGAAPDNSSYSYFDLTLGDFNPNAPEGGGDSASHLTVDANPCTHNAIAAYITGLGEVVVKFVSPDGHMKWRISVDTMQLTDIGATLGLDRYVPRVSMATAADIATGKCYLFTAYDYSDSVADGDFRLPRIYAKMKVWDITQEGSDNPSPIQSFGGSSNFYSWHSTVTASAFTHNVGWFFYHRDLNVSTTSFRGFVDKNFALGGMTDIGDLSSTTIGADPGGGDYIAAMPGGDRGGLLVPSWAENGAIIARWVAP